MGDLVVGVDAGGTATRCLLASAEGAVLGRGQAAGANQRSSGSDPAVELAAALREALGDTDPTRVAAGVFGVAGAGAAGHAAARGMAESAWRSAGLPGRPTVVTDIAVAFAAGTPAHEGIVLIAGTGAVAAAVSDARVVRRCDGYGWLLGDEGSAVWIGREAVRAALAALDGRGPSTSLVNQVTRTLLSQDPSPDGTLPGHPSTDAVAQALVAVVYGRSPAELGLLAPVVARGARAGDSVARGITEMAAQRLIAGLEAVHDAVPDTAPTVLTGSVLREGPVAEAVHAALAERGVDPVYASDGVLGAATLALRTLGGDASDIAAAHARLATALARPDPSR